MTHDLYSPLLVFALVNLLIAAASLGANHYKHNFLPPWVPLFAAVLVLTGVVLALASHLLLGHPRGTIQALAASSFLAAHPAPFIIAGLGLLLLVLSVRRDAA